MAAKSKAKAKRPRLQGGALQEKRGNQSYRSPFHLALVELLKARRDHLKLSLEKTVERLPSWMGFNFSTLARVERVERDLSAQELRELSMALQSSIDQLSAEADR